MCYDLPMERPELSHDYHDNIKLRKALTKGFFELTKLWDLTRQQQALLLGWNYTEKRTTLDSMRTGKTFIDRDQDKIERMIDLINIHKSLRILFPYDRDNVYEWVKIKRGRFGDHSALDVMLSEGRLGILAIRNYLDYERTR